ncbi:PP2C family protein-serine/threonine phosphatase [Kitasatospora sp. NPDC049258]|uniref:PP2C family protein-serine/threonine phosphatase n=1 Tax=Kitasatospora sp. NPDC049258 TaxID=3155394 RepID=UPI00342FA81D
MSAPTQPVRPAPVAARPAEPRAAGATEATAVARWQQALAEATRAPRWVRRLPVLLVVVDLALEYALPESVAAGFLCTVLPVVVAFSLGPGLVGAATVFTIALQGVLAGRAGHLFEQHHVWVYVTTVLAGLLGAALSWQRRKQARDLVRVRTIADTLQHAVLRPVPAEPGGLRAAGLYRPAQADVAVGGDLYEVCETRYGTRVLLGDVRGKGLDAVRTVADVIGAFRIAAHETADLADLARQLDRQVLREAADCGDEELFVTAVLLQHCPRTGRVELVNRGHLEPLLLSPGSARPLDCPDQLPLGLGDLAAGGEGPTAVELPAGCTLLLYTDGVTEARDRAGAFYPLVQRLARLGTTDPRAVVAFLDQDVRSHSTGLADDLAVLALTPA